MPLLVVACEVGVNVALALIHAGAGLNKTDGEGRCALEVAVARGEWTLCEELLTKGAMPTRRQDAAGNSMLHLAVIQRADSPVRLLVRRALGRAGGAGGRRERVEGRPHQALRCV